MYPVRVGRFGVADEPDLVQMSNWRSWRNGERWRWWPVAGNGRRTTGFRRPSHQAELLNDGAVDIYLSPPMVDAVRKHLADQGVQPMSFYYEKFAGSETRRDPLRRGREEPNSPPSTRTASGCTPG